MNESITTWRLMHPRKRLARCVLSRRAGGWQIVVWNHSQVAMWERHPTRDDALVRAAAIRAALATRGWTVVPDDDAGWRGLRARLTAARTRAAAASRWTVGITAGTAAVWLWRRHGRGVRELVRRLHPEPHREGDTARLATTTPSAIGAVPA